MFVLIVSFNQVIDSNVLKLWEEHWLWCLFFVPKVYYAMYKEYICNGDVTLPYIFTCVKFGYRMHIFVKKN